MLGVLTVLDISVQPIFMMKVTAVFFGKKTIKYGNKFQENLDSAQVSLFGESSEDNLLEPSIPVVEPWNSLKMLNKRKRSGGFLYFRSPLR